MDLTKVFSLLTLVVRITQTAKRILCGAKKEIDNATKENE